mgnify:CR=1 FL=1
MRQVLGDLAGQTRPEVLEILDLATRYASDAEWYLSRGDCLTALACISYAEGLLDALRIEKRVSFEWPSAQRTVRRVLVGGVFDILHPGHIAFLSEAASLGEVYVVVARDETVKQTKGHYPVLTEEERLLIVRSLKQVREAFLGEYPPDYRSALMRVKPDVVLLGYDQAWMREEIEKACSELGLSVEVRVGGSLEGYSSSAIKRRILDVFRQRKGDS